MATSAEIKSNNNTLIRVKTVAKSITKQSVADQLDACIDYTVQEIGTLNSNKENTNNKSTNIVTDNGSDVKYPTTKAVATYVDNLSAESWTNKSTNVTTDGASDTKYPSVKAVKYYVDEGIGVVNYGTITSLNIGIPLTQLPYKVNQMRMSGEVALPPTNLVGFVLYVNTSGVSNTIYANFDKTGYFLTTSSGGTSILALTTDKLYRFTYLGDVLYAKTWLAELIL